ncbi:hypothetical protein [Enterobacter ludwigii]
MTDSNDKKVSTNKAKTTTAKARFAPINGGLTASSLPTVDDLKARFKTGSIPLQTDFAELIDMANAGAKATGQAAGQSGPGMGLVSNSGLLEVKQGSGIVVSADGVSVDINNILPKGMITMFSGSAVPAGWRLCDGTNETPNLVDRFILGGVLADIDKENNKTLTGASDVKQYTVLSDSKVVEITGKTDEVVLTLEQIPTHKHQIGIYMENDGNPTQFSGDTTTSNSGAAVETDPSHSPRRIGYTESVGGEKGHSHAVNIKSNEHAHEINPIPPYYILAFIIKT